jgi:hypothetical protein
LNLKDVMGDWFRVLKAKREFLGLDAPRPRDGYGYPRVVDATEPVENAQAAQFLAELAAWARRTNAINVNGFNPALPRE